jgi:hypothetical protein
MALNRVSQECFVAIAFGRGMQRPMPRSGYNG